MEYYERLRPCWIRGRLRDKSELTKAGLATKNCGYRDEGTYSICEYPSTQRERVIVCDRALLTLLDESYSFCSAVAIYLASQGQ